MTSAKVDQVLTQDQVLRQMGLHWNDWERSGQPTVVPYANGVVLYPIVALSHFAPITLTTMLARRNRGS